MQANSKRGKNMKKTMNEFRDFAMKGNVVDMAIGVVVGGAFGKIVTSLVNNIIMPLLSVLTGKVSFVNWTWTVVPAREGLEPIIVQYGMFLQTIFDFLIIAFSIFMVIKIFNKIERKKDVAPVIKEDPKPSSEELLLMEIRDLLKKQN